MILGFQVAWKPKQLAIFLALLCVKHCQLQPSKTQRLCNSRKRNVFFFISNNHQNVTIWTSASLNPFSYLKLAVDTKKLSSTCAFELENADITTFVIFNVPNLRKMSRTILFISCKHLDLLFHLSLDPRTGPELSYKYPPENQINKAGI